MENEIDLIEHSRYYSNTDFMDMHRKTNSEISILNLNCGSLNAKIDNLKMFLDTIDNDSKITCITLQDVLVLKYGAKIEIIEKNTQYFQCIGSLPD